MFLGEYHTKFTGIGRVILPKGLRDEFLGKVIILSKGFEDCIWGFTKEDFEEEAKKQLEISATDERARYMRRYLFSASVAVELDSQGRFNIPSALLAYAKLEGEVVIIGAGDHFEIWNNSNWQRHIKDIERDYGRIS